MTYSSRPEATRLHFAAALAVAATLTTAAIARAQFVVPAWAFPQSTAVTAPPDSVTPRHVPDSRATYTAAQAGDFFRVLDWHPNDHPAMPAHVAHGRKPGAFACAYCHLAEGTGRPENAMLAGLPPAYIQEQVADIRSGARRSAFEPSRPFGLMRQAATNATDVEIAAAVAYYSSLHPRQRSRVVETRAIPRVIAGAGLYFRDPRGGTEPLGHRLIEIAASRERHELHDARTPYVAYVPPGSIARGHVLATRGIDSVTRACTSCHGPDLRGVALIPPLAGRAPSYILRQLIAFRTGARSSAAAAPMRQQAAGLSLDDMIAAAAYAGSLKP